jgi:uncharacterized protein
MSERDSYPAGVPCWVTNLQHDVPAARAFYEELFGWETVGGPEGEAPYAVARVRGRDVAGIGTHPVADAPGDWVMEVRTDDLARTAEQVATAGGEVLQAEVDFGEVGRLGVFTDTVGALFTAWEGRTREGAQIVNEAGAWAMNALQTADPERAARFYGDVFGWTTEAFGPATLFRLPGYVGGEESQPVPRDVVAVMMPASDEVAPRWGTDFWVSDAARAVETVRRNGGTVLVEPYDAPPFRQAVVADPGGAAFSISELRRA